MLQNFIIDPCFFKKKDKCHMCRATIKMNNFVNDFFYYAILLFLHQVKRKGFDGNFFKL